jgi:hypothetical protein
MRTNNGIVQIATGTSSGSSASTAAVFVFNSPNIQIASTYSADSVSPRSGYYTDLGTSTYRWKDLYLGGSSTALGTINCDGGFVLKNASDGILTTDSAANSNAPIEISTSSSNANKDRPLFLNVRYGTVNGSTNYIAGICSQTLTFTNNAYVIGGAGAGISFDDGIQKATHFGDGFGRAVYESDMHVIGGKHAIKGMADDGSSQYDKSEWITTQYSLRTSDANWSDLVTIGWTGTASGGNVMQVKAYVIGTLIDDASIVYSAEIMGAFSIDAGLTASIIGTPILNAVSSWTGTQPDIEMTCDADAVYLKVQGVGTQTIQWLCSYSYHRLINIV